MKSLVLTAACAVLFFGALHADVPALKDGVKLEAAGGNLKVSYYSAPACVDWNSDGRKDLLVGQFYNGHINLFINEGTDINPVFNASTLVESGGTPISCLPYG